MKRNYVEELRNKIPSEKRFIDIKFHKMGYPNFVFYGFTVTNEKLKGSIWDDYENDEFMKKKVIEIRDKLLKLLDS